MGQGDTDDHPAALSLTSAGPLSYIHVCGGRWVGESTGKHGSSSGPNQDHHAPPHAEKDWYVDMHPGRFINSVCKNPTSAQPVFSPLPCSPSLFPPQESSGKEEQRDKEQALAGIVEANRNRQAGHPPRNEAVRVSSSLESHSTS